MRADCTIQDVFNRFYPEYTKTHKLSAAQRKAAYHIRNCKTGAFGVNVSVCEECGCISIHYNSCRDRCCPMCQEFPKEKWVDARREDVLDAPYFHVVFTVPEELNPVIYSNQKLLYDALYHASSDTLRELASDSKYLGAEIGYICILHTWGSEMNFHPHIHAVVLGGGLDSKRNTFGKTENLNSTAARSALKTTMHSKNCWTPVTVKNGSLTARNRSTEQSPLSNISGSIPTGSQSATTVLKA